MVREREPGSPLVSGINWASRVTTVALGFSVPPLLGFAIDRWLGTVPVATLIGVVLGFVSGMIQTVRLAGELPGGKGPKTSRPRTVEDNPTLKEKRDSQGGSTRG